MSTPSSELTRPIPQASTELMQLLAQGVSSDLLLPIVKELEQGYKSIHESYGVTPNHVADAANMMNGIRTFLSDSRLSELGIISELAWPAEEDN